ncbi:MAG TPA: ABC transporter permease [Candidatus Methylomirabilis sp.]|nr:ABC transporter permease [Candidatus Methylomirabilis sp.]
MKTYVVRRLVQSVGVCLVISIISFFLLFMNADPALLLLPPEAEVKDIQAFKTQMGLDQPVIVQYARFLGRAVFHADFGQSFVAKVPALELIAERLPATVELTLAVMIVVSLVSIPVGVLSAVRPYSLADNVATFCALLGQAMPLYWFGIMLIIVFGVWLRWLPVSGSDSLAHLIMPAVTLAAWILPVNMRLIRSGMLDVLNQDYIRTARAKGLIEQKVLIKHALRNAAIPLVTVLGMQIALLLGGAVVTETVFAWPGMGRLAVDSIRMGDYPVVQAIVVIFAVCVIISNLLADILAALLDPRIRLE